MTRLEMVEKLRDKTGATYDEARAALEKSGWDMLDAVMALDRMQAGGEKTASKSAEEDTTPPIAEKNEKARMLADNVGGKISSGVKFVLGLICKGEALRIEVMYKDNLIGSVSVTVLALLLILCWYVPVALAIIGLLTGYRFRFSNNSAVGKLLNTAGAKIKSDIENDNEKTTQKHSEE